MNKLINTGTKIILGAFLSLNMAYAQSDIFNHARTGDTLELKNLILKNPKLISSKDSKGYTPLILASYHGHLKTTQALIELGANPCEQDQKGNTALMGVIFKGHKELIEYLIPLCDIDMTNKEGQTALMFASLFGREEVAKRLIEKGANREILDNQGRNALMLAESQWNQAMAKVLKTFKIIQ